MPSATSTNLAKPKPPGPFSEAGNDASLFRASVGDVKPLTDSGRITPAPARAAPRPRQRVTDTRVTPDLLSDHLTHSNETDELGFLRPGVTPQALRRLRRGHWPIQDELDLHGLTRDAARTYLVAFLNHCQQHDVRCVRIIHGKGLSSKNHEPVLKQLVRSWLTQRPDVLAFTPAQPNAGGAGALMVLLKRGPTNRRDEPSRD